jgi:phosphatidylserine synthase
MLSILMVSTLEYDTLPKFAPHSAWNRCKLGFFLLAVLLVIFFTDKVFFPLSVVYVMSGLIRWFFHLVSDWEVAGVVR